MCIVSVIILMPAPTSTLKMVHACTRDMSSYKKINCVLILQLATMEHFHWQPLSVLIADWDNLDSVLDGLDHNHCEMIRATPSFHK